MVFIPHPGNDLLCSEKLLLWEGPPLAVYGDLVVLFDEFVVYSRRQCLGDLVIRIFGGGGWCSWEACGWCAGSGGCDALVDGFVCCHQRCFEGVKVIAVEGSYLVGTELDF